MKQVLWINSCMRGAGQSRTLELCRTFLEELRVRRPGLKVAERDLTRAELPVMTAELSRRREELAAEGLSGVGLHTGDHIWIHTGGGAAGAVPGRAADLYYHRRRAAGGSEFRI